MTALRLSQDFLNVAPLLYFAAMVLGVLYWIRKGRVLYVAIPVVAACAILLHSAALGIRWVEGGLYRPPWTNLYESLVYFSWGLAVLSYGTELKFKIRYLGIFAYALVFIGLGLAYLTPSKAINPLVPALQSWWILAHSFLAAFAYSGLLLGSIFSFLYLIKVGMKQRTAGLAAAGIGAIAVALAGGTDLLNGVYRLNEMIFLGGEWLRNPIPGSQPQAYYQVTLPLMGPLMIAAIAVYLVTLLLFCASRTTSDTWRPWALRSLFLATGLHLGSIGLTYYHIATRSTLTLGSNPYHLGFVTLFGVIQLFLLLLAWSPQALAKRLAEASKLDRMAQALTLFGFPFMTLILITGAIWAHEAWGRYWGWDPKETTSLVTWLIYAAYIHARRLPGWAGKRAAVICVVGFFSVLFTYLGANLVLSGLHAYGAQ